VLLDCYRRTGSLSSSWQVERSPKPSYHAVLPFPWPAATSSPMPPIQPTQGEGNTVEEAEQDAARVALEMLAPAPAGEAEAAKVQPTGSAPVEPLVPDVEESSDQPRPAAQKPGAVVQDQADGTVKGGSGSRSVQESARELVQLLDALLRDERVSEATGKTGPVQPCRAMAVGQWLSTNPAVCAADCMQHIWTPHTCCNQAAYLSMAPCPAQMFVDVHWCLQPWSSQALASQEHELACYLADVEGPGLGGQQGPGGWLAVPALAQVRWGGGCGVRTGCRCGRC
jgi:hypothetical protein